MPNDKRSHPIRSYRDREVRQPAMDTVVDTYHVSWAFPSDERFALTAQATFRRCIPSNIAAGHDRLGSGEFRRVVSVARGAVAEVETQLVIGVRLDSSNAAVLKTFHRNSPG